MNSAGSMRILGTDDTAEWTAVLAHSRQHDFHHLPQYHRVAEQRGEGAGQLFVYREGDCTIALPLLLRPVDPREPDGWRDATSVYGYGGPVGSHDTLPAGVARNFQTALAEELVRRRVVALFSRLHPLIAQDDMLAGVGDCPASGETISIDLTEPGDAQRAQFNKSCRTSLRKLRELGFTGLHDCEKRYLPEFVSVYLETMRRAGAQSSYFFDETYFNLLTRELEGVSHLFVVLKDGEVAAATVCTICDGIVQDHLGGTRDAFLKFSPDRLVVDTERMWAAEMGARVFHLGGGVGAQQDSLFRYKSGFSDRRHIVRTWRWILRPDIYEALSASAERWNEAHGLRAVSAGYFPAYRCPTTTLVDEVSQAPAMRVLRPEQADEWMSVLRRATQHDFYFLPGYHALAERRGEGTAHLFAYRDGDYTIALPLLLRSIEQAADGEAWSDATSVYGYAGPVASHATLPESVVRNFQESLRAALVERRVAAVFSRLHPLLDQRGTLARLGECRTEGETVSIDLTLPAEEQGTQYRASIRTRIESSTSLQAVASPARERRRPSDPPRRRQLIRFCSRLRRSHKARRSTRPP